MVIVREMREADIEAVSTVRVNSWKVAYAGLIPAAHLDGMNVETDAVSRREWFERGAGSVDNLVAEVDGAVVGWACLGPCRDEDALPGDGEIYAIYALPDWFGTGVGRALMQSAMSYAAQRSYERVLLWVLRDNPRARRFYAAAGFAPDGAEEGFAVGAATVPEVRYVTRTSPNGRYSG